MAGFTPVVIGGKPNALGVHSALLPPGQRGAAEERLVLGPDVLIDFRLLAAVTSVGLAPGSSRSAKIWITAASLSTLARDPCCSRFSDGRT